MKSEIELLRKLVREELGRNIQSPPAVDVMRDWRHLPGVQASVYVDPSKGVWYVDVTDEETGKKHPTMGFAQESEAVHYARKTAFDIYNNNMQGASGKVKEPSWK